MNLSSGPLLPTNGIVLFFGSRFSTECCFHFTISWNKALLAIVPTWLILHPVESSFWVRYLSFVFKQSVFPTKLLFISWIITVGCQRNWETSSMGIVSSTEHLNKFLSTLNNMNIMKYSWFEICVYLFFLKLFFFLYQQFSHHINYIHIFQHQLWCKVNLVFDNL